MLSVATVSAQPCLLVAQMSLSTKWHALCLIHNVLNNKENSVLGFGCIARLSTMFYGAVVTLQIRI